MRVSAQSRWPRKKGELAPRASCGPGEHLRGVPVVGEAFGVHLQVQLDGRAGGLRGERVGVARDALPRRPLELEPDVLTAGVEHGVVEGGVADVLADPVTLEVLGHDGRQDADRDDAGVELGGALRRPVERAAQVGLEIEGGVAGQRPRRHVELDVVAGELGLVVGVGDLLEDRLVVELGAEILCDEVELDLDAGHRPVELELAVAQHAFEHVEVSTHLLAVLLALLACVSGLLDVGSHVPRQPHSSHRREDNPLGGQTSNGQLSNASGGGHEQTRCRSP